MDQLLPTGSPPASGPSSSIAEAIESRRSVRAFLSTPVEVAVLRRILALAGRAPSGSNLQPWRVFVLTGGTLQRLGDAIQGAYLADEPGHRRDYTYYTDPIPEPFLSRKRACGWGLYGTLGISRGEKGRMKTQRATNYNFFGAPAALVFTIDRVLEQGSWLDYGMFIQTVMLAARGEGLHSCAQASIAEYPDIVRRELPVAADHLVVGGMALGYADPAALVNQFTPDREGVEGFATFLD